MTIATPHTMTRFAPELLPDSLLPDSPAASLAEDASPPWRKAGLRYYSYRYFLRQTFGNRRVQKVSLDAGFTCPNVDGTVATGGCTFCDNRSFSPSRRNRLIGSSPGGKAARNPDQPARRGRRAPAPPESHCLF